MRERGLSGRDGPAARVLPPIRTVTVGPGVPPGQPADGFGRVADFRTRTRSSSARRPEGPELPLAARQLPEALGGVGQRDVVLGEHRGGVGVQADVGEQLPMAFLAGSGLAATSRLSQSARSCQTTVTPA